MLRRKKVLTTASVLALCVSLTASCVSSNASQVSGKYENPFLDVKDSDWFSADIQYTTEQGLMTGTSDTTFSPNDTTTRGMLVTILWRLDGKSEVHNDNSFKDVENDQYYYDAVSWAVDNAIVSGYSETQFAPNDSMTREQLAAVLYRYANYKQYDISDKVDLSTYKDVDKISGYAVDAFKWANANGIISGTSSDMLEPQGNAQRAQIASILSRFCEKYAANTENDKVKAENASTSTDYTDNKDEPANKNEHTHSSGGSSSENIGGTHQAQDEINQAEKPVEIVPNTEPTIMVDSVTVKSGKNVQVIVKIENNPGILGMTLTANYDESFLTLESVENGEAFNGILDLTTSKDLKSGSRFVWDGVDISDDNIKNGTMLIMNFKVSSTASTGNYPITLTYADGDIVDKNLSEVAVQIVNGYIAVEN